MKRIKKSFLKKILLFIEILFDISGTIFKVNNSFAVKNDKLSYFENFNHANHLKGTLMQI